MPRRTAGEEKCTDPVGCRHAMVPLLTHSETTSPGPPLSLNVPTYTQSNATRGDDVIPLNFGWAIRVVFQTSVPLEALSRYTRPLEAPTMTEPSNTAGDEKPFTIGFCHWTPPVPASNANSPRKVSTYNDPKAIAGVETISRVWRFRSHRTVAPFGAPDPEVPVPPAWRAGESAPIPSPRNPRAGYGNNGVGTGVRAANVTESNAAFPQAIASPSDRTSQDIPTVENSQARAVRFHTKRPGKPEGPRRSPMSCTAILYVADQEYETMRPWAFAPSSVAFQDAFTASRSGIVTWDQ